jgi:hypothetical protein
MYTHRVHRAEKPACFACRQEILRCGKMPLLLKNDKSNKLFSMNGFTLVEVSKHQYSAASGAPERCDKAGVDLSAATQ